jgi:predicted DNA-binding protein
MSNNNRKVFLSYAREDKKRAEEIKQLLDDWKFDVWFDGKSLDGGEEWPPEVAKEINSRNFFVVLLSQKAIDKKDGFIHKEIKQALHRWNKKEENFFIIPVRLERCMPSQPEFKDINWIDLFTSWELGCRKLTQALINKVSVQLNNREIIGFDLGHGETAIAKTSLYVSKEESKFNTVEPKNIEIINGKQSIITAVGMKNGKILVGDDAYGSKDVTNLRILFKSYKLDDPNVREPIENFVKGCLNQLQGKINLDENTYFIVGSPSGWKEIDRKKYEEVLKKAGMINVTVRPESRAAFLEAKESAELSDFSLLDDCVLIIDIGSSTTDFTIVKNYEEKPLDFGHNQLGSGLLDIAIFNRTLEKFSQEERNKFNDVFREKPELKAQCLLKCREIKEAYFSKSSEDDWIQEPVPCDPKEVKEDLYFKVKLYKQDMAEILNSPISELSDKSWLQSFHDELVQCKRSSVYQTPKLVLLTGGASRMGFILSTCKKVFPPETRIRIGSEPSLTISKGLAYVGRIDYKVDKFMDEIMNFTVSNRLPSNIKNRFEELSKKLSKLTFDIFREVIKSSLLRWCKGDISLISNLENEIHTNAAASLKDEKCLKKFDEEINIWLEELSLYIQEETRIICVKYGIKEATFKLELTKYNIADNNMSRYFKSEEMIERKLLTMGSGIVGVILGAMLTAFFYESVVIGGAASTVLGAGLGLAVFGLLKIEPLSKMATDAIRTNEIPKLLRLLDNNQIDEMLDKGRPDFEKDVIEQFQNQSEKDLNKLIQAIEKDLLKCADKARILIK